MRWGCVLVNSNVQNGMKKRIAYNRGISNVFFRAISVENTFLFTVISHVYTTENNKALHMFLE